MTYSTERWYDKSEHRNQRVVYKITLAVVAWRAIELNVKRVTIRACDQCVKEVIGRLMLQLKSGCWYRKREAASRCLRFQRMLILSSWTTYQMERQAHRSCLGSRDSCHSLWVVRVEVPYQYMSSWTLDPRRNVDLFPCSRCRRHWRNQDSV